jgi:hypothetical protein
VNVTLFGASGIIGSAVGAELEARDHRVRGVARNPSGDGYPAVAGDAADPVTVRELVHGADVVVSAVGPRRGTGDDTSVVVRVARTLLDVLREAPGTRLVVVGGAGSLRTPSGVALIDTPEFPEAWKPGSAAQGRALELYRGDDIVPWTYVSPAASISPGARTGDYRTGSDDLLIDPTSGRSHISVEDFAVAVADVVERGVPERERITVAY